jgi:Holliday junction DNA helicase RuvB
MLLTWATVDVSIRKRLPGPTFTDVTEKPCVCKHIEHDAAHEMAERIVNPESREDEDYALRPASLAEFSGQAEVCEHLRVFISGAKERGEHLDHVLLSGPPGLGKTTLARIVATELGVGFRSLAAPSIQRVADLAAVLAVLNPKDVLFIDEIHRLNQSIEEILYGAMEDFQIDIMVDAGGRGEAVSVPLNPFTLVGATTRKGMLSTPLRDRFGIPLELQLYSVEDLALVVARNARLLGLRMTDQAIHEVAMRSRGTPRIAGRLLRRLRDFATAERAAVIDDTLADRILSRLGVDRDGLDDLDRRYLRALGETFKGRPVGVKTLAATLNEDVETLEVSVEPYLLRQGYILRTQQGRVLADHLREFFGLKPVVLVKGGAQQGRLF